MEQDGCAMASELASKPTRGEVRALSATLRDVEMLHREVYTEPVAARLLGVAPSTLHYWLEGGRRGEATYAPIIRPEPTGARSVTWAEFVEAGWLKTYRKKQVAMSELRSFISELRTEFGVPYPLAHKKPLVSGKSLVHRAQQEAGISDAYRLVDDQLMLTFPGQTFVDRIEWAGDVAVGWRPDGEKASTVIVRPDVRFGRPSVGGVSTVTLWEQSDEASQAELAEEFGLTLSDVRWALSYENGRRAPGRAA